jgi:hypothetical protein
LNHPKPALTKDNKEDEPSKSLVDEDDEILTAEEKNKEFLKKVPKGQESHIKHVLDR